MTTRRPDDQPEKEGAAPKAERERPRALTQKEQLFEQIHLFSAREDDALGMSPWIFMQATLPHSDPGDVPVYMVENGRFVLQVRPGYERGEDGEPRSLGIPYGGMARLVVAYVTTHARSKETRLIDFGDTLAAFMRDLHLTPRGGERGSIRYLKDQLERLGNAVVTVEWRGEDHEKIYRETLNIRVASRAQFWWKKDADPDMGFGGGIELSEEFYDEIVRGSIPIDMRKLHVLRSSPLGMDLYVWLTHKAYQLSRQPNPQPLGVSWSQLHEQFGANYSEVKEFARKCRRELKKIEELWPKLRYVTPRGRLLLQPCDPDIPS